MTAAYPSVALAVLNLADGPGTSPDGVVADRVRIARAQGIEMVGYVDTASGERPIADVLKDIGRYLQWYEIGGVFLDRAHVGESVVTSYYRPLYRTIKAWRTAPRVVLNAGAAMPESIMDATDVLCLFEGDYELYLRWAPPSWVNDYRADRFWHIVHAIPRQAALEKVLELSRARRAGWLYATDQADHAHRPGGHLYDRLPSVDHWHQLVEALSAKHPLLDRTAP